MNEHVKAEEVDRYAWWRRALDGDPGPVHDGDPQPGFYRKRAFKKGPWQSVAIWELEGKVVAKLDHRMVDADELWTWVYRNPVSHEDYEKAMENGFWDDDPDRTEEGKGAY